MGDNYDGFHRDRLWRWEIVGVAGSVFRGVEFSGSASLVSEMEKLGVVIS
jgi:hypothetical protein